MVAATCCKRKRRAAARAAVLGHGCGLEAQQLVANLPVVFHYALGAGLRDLLAAILRCPRLRVRLGAKGHDVCRAGLAHAPEAVQAAQAEHAQLRPQRAQPTGARRAVGADGTVAAACATRSPREASRSRVWKAARRSLRATGATSGRCSMAAW